MSFRPGDAMLSGQRYWSRRSRGYRAHKGGGMADESRAAQIERAIREIADLDVVVEDADGVITLEGIVDSERDREAAEDIAADLAGGASIDNALEVQDLLPVSVDTFSS